MIHLNFKVSVIVIIAFFCIASAKKCGTDSIFDSDCDTIYLECSGLINKYFEKAATNPNTKSLHITHCNHLTDISALKSSYLKTLELYRLGSLINISPLMNLTTMESLSIGGISNNADLSILYKLPRLNSLWLFDLPNLKSLNFLTTQKKLNALTIGLLDSTLDDYSIINSLSNLRELFIIYPNINDYRIFKKLHNLKRLKITQKDTLDLNGLEVLTALEEIDFEAFYLKNSYSTIQTLSKLKKIRIVNCLTAGFPNLDFINEFKHIEKLILEGITDTDTIRLSNLNIQKIYMSNMSKLKFLSLSNLPNLEHIMISDFDSLATFRLNNVPNLKKLTIFNMQSLESLPDLTNVPNLNILTIGNSEKIKIKDENVQTLSKNDTLENNCSIDPELMIKLKDRHCIIKEWNDSEIANRNSLK